ncbi:MULTISPECIES: MotA/TolQ/ExbB proton channel family protein [Rodentibacter]|uniref:MotA/TolQ/ExbB proton channel family protein n=1 Tax=Rodentibacter TaxID=1960084 RepID=UPI001CFD2665|nr:MotA/TolQ/ExbB proton channel family protein [Rodentibacter sp. JRC1]GJI56491.1 hypothetical protein HEMROJRC1_16030 [Rodentibacter sp. JRC1]
MKIYFIFAFILSILASYFIASFASLFGQQFFMQISAEKITTAFYFAMFCLFLFSFLLIKTIGKLKAFIQSTPTFLTSIGILGTFTGIVIGLLEFNPQDIDSSITHLLAGMKTAFLTSVIGVFLSISFKIIHTLCYKQEQQSNDSEFLIQTFYQQAELIEQLVMQLGEFKNNVDLQQTRISKLSTHQIEQLTQLVDLFRDFKQQQNAHQDNIQAFYSTQNESLLSLTRAIGSDSDNSLLGQIMQLRNQLSEQFNSAKQLIENGQTNFNHFEQNLEIQLKSFADILSKSATETVIEALNQVIRDFNHNLTEQFGENFKELNRAVNLLVEWQENYKQQLVEMIKQYQLGVAAISETEQAVGNIEKSTQTIPQSMQNLEQVITTNQQQIVYLNEHLSAFAQLREKAVNALPMIQTHIQKMVEGVSQATENYITQSGVMNQRLAEQSESLIDHNRTINNQLAQISENFSESTEQVQQCIKDTAEKCGDVSMLAQKTVLQTTEQLEKMLAGVSRSLEHTQTELLNSFQQILKNHASENSKIISQLGENNDQILKESRTILAQQVEKQLELIDQSIQTELERVLNQMGSSLATITGRFTQDYEQLVKAMKNIVEQH